MRAKRTLGTALSVGAAVVCLLAAAPAEAVRILQTAVSPNGRWQIELADYAQATKFELWATPAAGGERRKIGGVVPFDNDVSEFLISADSSRVAYRQGRTATGDWLLYSTPISGQAAIRICQPMTLGGGVEHGISLALDGNVVRYLADPWLDEQYFWFLVPFVGGAIVGDLFRDGFESGGAEAWQ